MSWRGAFGNVVNQILGRANLSLTRRELDFEDRLQSPKHLQAMFRALAAALDTWLVSQTVFSTASKFDLTDEIRGFYDDYLQAPFRDLSGGSRFNNLLCLNLIAKWIQPLLIVDSGTYTGASAWALSRGAPGAAVFSFDIDLSHLRLRAPGVTYIESNWTDFDFSNHNVRNGLCYFDDHVDQAKRLIEASDLNFGLAIFDDDFTIGAFPAMARDAGVLPKIEFVLDDSLQDGEELVWICRGVRRVWRVDRGYLDRARATVLRTGRMPNTSLLTGIHQTPYRIVALR
jgi:hypothetical protein